MELAVQINLKAAAMLGKVNPQSGNGEWGGSINQIEHRENPYGSGAGISDARTNDAKLVT